MIVLLLQNEITPISPVVDYRERRFSSPQSDIHAHVEDHPLIRCPVAKASTNIMCSTDVRRASVTFWWALCLSFELYWLSSPNLVLVYKVQFVYLGTLHVFHPICQLFFPFLGNSVCVHWFLFCFIQQFCQLCEASVSQGIDWIDEHLDFHCISFMIESSCSIFLETVVYTCERIVWVLGYIM